ncbi:MAG: manganese efflux pump [Clostridia bacterium]|nr:manganese efflux pump [Clostridia bacterium]
MIILTAILTGIGLSMDAFAVSVTNGMCTGKLKFRHALADGLTFGFFQALMPLIGLFVGLHFMQLIETADHWIAFALLAFIGGNMIRGALKKDEIEECAVNPYTVKNLLLQGIATSIDALAVGVGLSATMTGYGEALVTVVIIGISTFIISTAGVYIGRLFGGMLKEKAEILGGIILIGIGLKILIEHLFF